MLLGEKIRIIRWQRCLVLFVAGLVAVALVLASVVTGYCAGLQRVTEPAPVMQTDTASQPAQSAPQPSDAPSPPDLSAASAAEETPEPTVEPDENLPQRPDIPEPPAEPEVPTPEQACEQASEQEPLPTEPTGDQIIIRYDEAYYEAGAFIGKGNVVVRLENMTIYADTVEIDEEGEQAMVHGNVRIETPHQVTHGKHLLINLENEQWELREGHSRVDPDYFESGQVIEPIYLDGQGVEAEPGGEPIHLLDGQFSSCSLEHKHYAICTHHAEVRPKNKVVVKKPAISLFGQRILRYPLNMVLSLEEDKNHIVPEIGQNDVEGYYAKFAFLYLAGQAASGVAKLQFTQRRGTGLGLEHYIDSDRQRAEGSLFFEPYKGSLAGRIAHEYQFSDKLSSYLRSSYQKNSGYFGTSSSDSMNLGLQRMTNTARSYLDLSRSASHSTRSTTRRYNLNLRHNQQLGARTQWRIRTNASQRTRRAGESPDEELDAEFEYRRTLDKLDWQLLVENRYDLDGSDYAYDSYFALNRLPEVTIRTDTRRLNDYRLLGRVSFDTSLQFGKYTQDPDDIDALRVALDTRFGGSEHAINRRTRLRTSARYLQAFYDEGSALFITNFSSTLRQDWGDDWDTQLSYRHNSRRGFAPLRIDYGGRRHDVSWQLAGLRPNRSRIVLSTGFDFISDRWRDLLLRTEYMPSRSSKVELQSGYSLQRAQWRPLNLRWQLVKPPRFYLTMGTNYDLERSELTRATMELDWTWHRWWRTQVLTGYTGYRNEFSTFDVQLTRDLHCLIASLAYSKELGEFRVNLGIKAFPSPERVLGIGRTGALFQSGSGQYF